jgi:hypothetical protein
MGGVIFHAQRSASQSRFAGWKGAPALVLMKNGKCEMEDLKYTEPSHIYTCQLESAR